jgi:hypothetical protein
MRAYTSDVRNSHELRADGSYAPLAAANHEGPGVQDRFVEQAIRRRREGQSTPATSAFRPARKPTDDAYG